MSLSVVIKGFVYSIILSTREISSGEKLYWNYGITHTIKLGIPHLELNTNDLINYAIWLNKNWKELKGIPNRKLDSVKKYYSEEKNLDTC